MMADGPLGFDEDPEDAERRRKERLVRRRDPDLPTPGAEPAEPPQVRLQAGASRYGWFVGVIGVLVLAVLLLGSFGREGPERLGVDPGGGAPPFAAPLALSKLAEADANDVNVAVKADQGDAGKIPACAVRRTDVLNFCALYEKGPVVLALFAPSSQECAEQLDQLDDAARRHPELAFAAVAIRGGLDGVRGLVRDRRWSFPVGYDDDGVLANAFGVVVCPQLTFVRKGGSVQGTSLGTLSPQELERQLDTLAAGGATGATGTTGGG